MNTNALLVSTLMDQMWHNCKSYWKASINEQNQIVFNNTLKKDVYCQRRTRRLFWTYCLTCGLVMFFKFVGSSFN